LSNKLITGLGIILLLAVAVYFGFGYYIYNSMTVAHPNCESKYMEGRRDFTPSYFKGEYDYEEINIYVTPYLMDSYENVEFTSRGDNVRISGWFVPASTPSDAVVIVTHGGDVCRRNTSVLLPAGMLANNGFNVLLIDLRNHGASEVVGKRYTVGAEEYKDVLGAFDWLVSQGYSSEKIGLMGVSMGAATSLNAFGAETNIGAIWADSSFADIPALLDDQLMMNGLPAFMKSAVLTVAKLDGYDLNKVSPIKSVQNHAKRPIMIIHGTQDEWISVAAAQPLYQAAGENAELWIIDGTRHVEAMFIYPEEYQARMVAFFERALGE
jgi:dipeptidyl aminopeptidase/acylaminoacyl peptidase